MFFPPAAVASRLGTVFSVEGAPENRAGKSLWPPIFSVSSWVLKSSLSSMLKAVCSPIDPFDQGVVATDEVKEEPPEPFQKIGPSTWDSGAKGWAGRWVGEGGGLSVGLGSLGTLAFKGLQAGCGQGHGSESSQGTPVCYLRSGSSFMVPC